ncbi:MAG: YlxR family protein [Phototrophicaceae bacterium]
MAHKQRHLPQRTCVVCRQKFDKRQLIRLVRTPDGIHVDPSGKQEGRGAYVCDSTDCRQQAASTTILNKALRMSLSDEDRQRLRDIAS